MRAERYLLSVPEAAQALGISKDLLYRLILGPRPEIFSLKLGRRRMIPPKAIEDYIAKEMRRGEEARAW